MGSVVLRRAMTANGGLFSCSVDVAEFAFQAIGSTIYYGYRAWGPNWIFDPAWEPGTGIGFISDVDANGNRFNPNKLLLDPYALEVSHPPQTPAFPDRAAYRSGAQSRLIDTSAIAPKGVVIDVPHASYGTKPTRAFKDDIIYEVHLRGFTKSDPTLPPALQGTYAGASGRAAYLRDLGVTAVEFLPLHQTQNALNDLPQFADSHNYWGYDSCSYFAPDRRYAADQSAGGPTREIIAMVKAFHDVGLKVYADVVYNHHEEGGVDADTGTTGTIYTLRGLDNASYYECMTGNGAANFYQSDNGVGPNVNAAASLTRDLIVDSLRYWTEVIGVDGFRFDLAAILGNENAAGGYSYDGDDPESVLNRAVRELPARPARGGTGVDLIAEPYTADGNGQEQGRFPVGWAEWNDRFRDTFRASQNKLGLVSVTPGAMATRFAGSTDLFAPGGRSPASSLNYIVCHDGMTLCDLHSYDLKNNEEPFPYGPSDGGRSVQDEMCWSHGGDVVQQQQAVRTSLALLLLSAGVPMLLGGSEMNRTQFGNNNAYNLDTAPNWFDWTLLTSQQSLVTFTRTLCAFRSAHPCLRPAAFFNGTSTAGGLKDLTWYTASASEVDASYFANPDNRFIAYRIACLPEEAPVRSIFVAYNGWVAPISATLPMSERSWWIVADTDASAESYDYAHATGLEAFVSGNTAIIGARSVQILIER